MRTVVILDNSGSGANPYCLSAIRSKVCQLTQQWVQQANPKDTFEIIVFNGQDSPYPVRGLDQLEMPYLEKPAWKHRAKLEKEYSTRIAEKFDDMPTVVNHSPLLEALRRCSSYGTVADAPWRVVMISDLLQQSEKIQLTASYLSQHEDAEITGEMLSLCPSPSYPPLSATVYWYPGLVTEKRAADAELHERIQSIFRSFLTDWLKVGNDEKAEQRVMFEPLEVK